MSDLLDTYEQEFSSLSSSIHSKLSNASSAAAPASLLRSLEREIEELDELFQSIHMEVSALPPSTKARIQPRMAGYKADYDSIKADFKKISSKIASAGSVSASADREHLLAGAEGRDRLLLGTQRLNDASNRLAESHRIALETEEIGANTLGQLRQQREQIVRANETLDGTNSYIDRNVRLLKDMGRRMAANRITTWAIIGVLVLIIILIVVIKVG